MEIVSITVAVNYHGELRTSCPALVPHCDASYVIADPHDEETYLIANLSGAHVVPYYGFRDRGAAFNKSGAVRTAQIAAHRTYPKAWILLIDADIVVPPNLREVIEAEPLQVSALYSMARLDYHTAEDYRNDKPALAYPHMHAGYFQLYRRRDILYAPWSESAGKCDWRFKSQFRSRYLLPGFCHHLGFKSQNWRGRVTDQWQ